MPEFNVETMVNIMAKQQADGGKPLSPAQRDTMMQHLKRLCSGTASVPQTVISNHAAALLRSFNNGTPLPPLPAPYSQPAPNLLQAQLMALPPQVRQQLGNMPPHQILAALQQMQMARPMQPAAPAPAQPRLGFTPEQLEVLRTQIIAFRKIKKQEPLQPAELAAIKPPPLPPAYTTPQPAPRPQAVAQAMLSQQQQQLQLQQQQLLAKQNMMRAAGMQAAAMKTPAAKTMPIKPNHPLLPGGPRPAAPPPVVLPLEDPVPPWRGPPPVEYRGNEVVSRAAGPLMTLGAATIEHGGLPAPLAQREKMVPGLMGPLWDLTRILDQEQQTQLIRRRRTRMAELEALLGLSDPSAAKAVARSAHLPLAELAPPLPAPPAALPGSAPHPHPDLKGLAEKGGAAGAGGGGGGLVAVKEEAGPGGQALQPGRTVGVKRAAEEGGGGGGEGLRPMPRLVPGFQPSPEGVPGRGALMLELRKLRLLDLQARLRTEVELEHTTRLGMGQDRDYYRFMKEGVVFRVEELKAKELRRFQLATRRMEDARNFKAAQQEQLNLLKDIRNQRNKGIVRLHERLNRDLAKQQEDDRSRRLDALRANDFEAYQELLRQQQGPTSEEEDNRFHAITKFLNETEDYLNKLASKVANIKTAHEAEAYVAAAMEEARRAGASDSDITLAGQRAALEFKHESELLRKEKNMQGDAQTRYYELAHSVQEDIVRPPLYLRPPAGASLREYQMVGLKWMVSLYNNHLNGILADEMGLGKTVQVMALIAYLMEHKKVFGPHLIIVPNAVMVNWKSELQQWLPCVRCVYYVGTKDERHRQYVQEVAPKNFNILVTTYEYIMRDRAKLSKIEWKYIIIDEAQRLKERQSKLSKDLDRFVGGRRLLLTGTPLQNELRELWNLLNLLLPEVFDNKEQFAAWFDEMLEQEGDDDDELSAAGAHEAKLLATEKKLVVVHRLHQILVPFMLRRQVQDVEGKLPPKVAVVVKVPMTPYQSAVYNWVKATSTIRFYPGDPLRAKMKHDFCPLNNKVMELRKVCNHPLLSFPADPADGFELMRQCGKLVMLDRMLVKFCHTGHRVLLFCTMTKLLDLLEVYLRSRTLPNGQYMAFRRIDGSTPLEMRESAIKEFNSPNTDVFIFLLSIRAAGRGLNLQTSDTVIIYDPDPNPKNEEQAIARSHRIGQKKEVRVIHLESVVDPVPREAGTTEAALILRQHLAAAQQAGQNPRYHDSVESLVRNLIQKQKIDMANEVIDAGRFDMTTTMDERKATLEAMLQDEERNKLAQNEVLSWHELNKLLARGQQELAVFDALDEEFDWPAEPPPPGSEEAVPPWACYTRQDIKLAQQVANKKVSTSGIMAIQDGTVRKQKSKLKHSFPPPGSSRGGRGRRGGRGGRGSRGGGHSSGGGGASFRSQGPPPGYGPGPSQYPSSMRLGTAAGGAGAGGWGGRGPLGGQGQPGGQGYGSLGGGLGGVPGLGSGPGGRLGSGSYFGAGGEEVEEEGYGGEEGPTASGMYSLGATTMMGGEEVEGGEEVDDEEVEMVEREEYALEEEEDLDRNIVLLEDEIIDPQHY